MCQQVQRNPSVDGWQQTWRNRECPRRQSQPRHPKQPFPWQSLCGWVWAHLSVTNSCLRLAFSNRCLRKSTLRWLHSGERSSDSLVSLPTPEAGGLPHWRPTGTVFPGPAGSPFAGARSQAVSAGSLQGYLYFFELKIGITCNKLTQFGLSVCITNDINFQKSRTWISDRVKSHIAGEKTMISLYFPRWKKNYVIWKMQVHLIF